MEDLQKVLNALNERLQNASGKYGGVEICAATKTRSAETINLAAECGIKTIGENRVQEYLEKRDGITDKLKVHIIGRLQTNKVKYIADRIDMIQSVDRYELANEISKRASAIGRVIPILVEVSPAGEISKGGVPFDETEAFIDTIKGMPGIRIEGLMAMMPKTDDLESIRPLFRNMRQLFERLRDADISDCEMKTLSMGMSGDAIVAAEEGATMVRIGTALFGARN